MRWSNPDNTQPLFSIYSGGEKDEGGSSAAGITGGVIAGVIFLLIILAVLYWFVLKKRTVQGEKSEVALSTRTEARKIEQGAIVTANRNAGDIDVEKSKKSEEHSEDEDPNVSLKLF